MEKRKSSLIERVSTKVVEKSVPSWAFAVSSLSSDELWKFFSSSLTVTDSVREELAFIPRPSLFCCLGLPRGINQKSKLTG